MRRTPPRKMALRLNSRCWGVMVAPGNHRLGHVLGGFLGRHVLHDDLELGEILAQRLELLLDEHGFAVEQVDALIGDFTVHQQHQAFALHGLQRRVDLAQIGHAMVGIGRGTCG
jgi:hypothetical protein